MYCITRHWLLIATSLLTLLTAGCADDGGWQPVTNGTIVLDTTDYVISDSAAEHPLRHPAGPNFSDLQWWGDRLVCRTEDLGVREQIVYLSEIDLESRVIARLTIDGVGNVLEVAQGDNALAAVVDDGQRRLLFKGANQGAFSLIDLPGAFKDDWNTNRRHLGVCNSSVLLIKSDTLWLFSLTDREWTQYAIPEDIRETEDWGFFSAIAPDPLQTSSSRAFLFAMDGGEWGGTCYRLSDWQDNSFQIDTVEGAIDNCSFIGTDLISRLWLVGSDQHMGANYSWCTVSTEDGYSVVLNQNTRSTRFIPPFDSSSPPATMLLTHSRGDAKWPTVVIHEDGFVSAAAITDSTLLLMYGNKGLYSLKYSSGLHQPQSQLSKIISVTTKGRNPGYLCQSLVDDRQGGVIFNSPGRGLVWVRNVNARPEWVVFGE